MPTTTLTPVAKEVAAPLTLDDRLALRALAMDDRLDTASADHAIRTAHIDIPVVSPGPPILPAWQPQHTSPVAQVLERAGHLIAEAGWSRHYLRETSGALCAIGAIREAARGLGLAEQATSTLMEQILAECPDHLSIGAWNTAQSGPAPVIRMLGQAAREADRH
ncbi:hypothetical protein [Streptomyces sp. ISL-94]|uniref:DUF6197 family protein n=1 Tax=Streptomyces sp. ISL-94 TaxID=2819190 RepID=UPI001BE75FD5|nr:hypothetical protein [Streptomyces sp. ISL-94]MBT2477629.1 hypothetical protein [Streptomyces sp. ISL-94]